MFQSNAFQRFTFVRGVGGKLSRLVYLVPRPGFGSSVNSYCTIILEYLVVRDVYIISDSQTEMFTSNVQFGYPCPRGGEQAVQAGLSCPPAQDLGQTVSSVNFYCTIILEYLVVRDLKIISVKLRCLHLKFSSVILVRGAAGQAVQAGLSCPPPPAQDLGQTVSSVNSYCTIILEYLVVRYVNIISAKLDCGLSILSEIMGRGGGKKNCPGQLAPTTCQYVTQLNPFDLSISD